MLVAFLFIVVSLIAFALSTTYRLSIEAKYYYLNDDFKTAYKLASIAHEREPYNMMAFTIKQQSRVILDLQEIINEAKDYYLRIQKIANKSSITKNERIRIKFLCEIIIDKFDSLNFPLLHKAFLYNEAKQYRDEFEKILKNIQIEAN